MHDLMYARFGEQRRKELLREAKMARRAREAAGNREGGAGRHPLAPVGRGLKRLHDLLLDGPGAGRGRRSEGGRP